LNDLAREKWKFDGYITSDCGAVSGVQNSHHYTKNSAETVNAVLSAGMDTDCGGFMSGKTMQTLYSSNATIAKMADTALTRLFAVQMRLGFFDPRSAFAPAQYGEEVINTPAHQALAREAADQSLVLLKNDAHTLPFSMAVDASGLVAVVGRNALATGNMQGNYFGTAPFLISPCDGFNATTRNNVFCDAADDGGKKNDCEH
jgi:beta-glucosidase-like glycosyl hydrolase